MTRWLAGLLVCGLLGVGMALRADTPALQVTPSERQFFDLGYQLGPAAFAYAELGKQATRGETGRQADPAPAARRPGAPGRAGPVDARDGFAAPRR